MAYTASQLVGMGFGGYQGWDDAGANADFAATGEAGKKTTGGGGGTVSGGGNIDLSVPSVVDFTEKAYAPADEALKAYVMALRGQQNPLDVYTKLESEAGLPGMRATASTLREQIGNLEDTIKRVEPNVAATTGNSLVTQSQRSGMIEARQRPLLQDLGTLTTGLGRISQDITAAGEGIGTKTGLFLQGQEQALKPYEVQLTALQDRAARLVTGFTADNQNNLQILMAKWNRSNELSDKETDQAFELLKQEKDYNNQIAQMQTQNKLDISKYWATTGSNQGTGTSTDTSKYYGTSTNYYSTPSISDLWNTG